jgi:transposase
VIELSNEDRSRLEALSRKGTAEARMVERARIVLAAAAGTNNADIADDLGIALNTVLKWRKRFFEEGIAGLADRKRSGRPRRFPPLVVAEIKALACELPATMGVPLSKWSCTDLAREVVERKVAGSISAAAVCRVLTKDAIKPWLHRSWIFPRDPDFAAKFRKARATVLDQATAALQAATLEAVASLRRNLACGTPAVEVSAARVVLEMAARATEQAELTKRLAALEELAGVQEGRRDVSA